MLAPQLSALTANDLIVAGVLKRFPELRIALSEVASAGSRSTSTVSTATSTIRAGPGCSHRAPIDDPSGDDGGEIDALGDEREQHHGGHLSRSSQRCGLVRDTLAAARSAHTRLGAIPCHPRMNGSRVAPVNSTQTDLSTRNADTASLPFSLPCPELFSPPKGIVEFTVR
jgi:hypothetical protein